jgi:NAD+ diphosphatase
MRESTNNKLAFNNPKFEAETLNHELGRNSLIFAFTGAQILLINNTVLLQSDIEKFNLSYHMARYIGKINKQACFAFELDQDQDLPAHASLIGIRKLYNLLPEQCLQAAIYAYQIIIWDRKNKYCGECGSLTAENLPTVLVKNCPNCQSEFYPKISPSVIVSVIRNDEILLAQHRRVTNGMYTVLAGFVNPGESLEECIHREIKEEAGISVCNIRYFGSQPWPFPDSLMIGFTADFDHGELKPDNDEILDLKWFKRDEIPEWPDKVSIARSLIDAFIES